MKINSTILEAIKEDGLHIVDEDGVTFETEEENAAIHQEMQDDHIDHATELQRARREQEQDEEEYQDWAHAYYAWI